MYNSAVIAEADIARGLDIIIHLGRHPYDRKRIIVENIVEVVYLEHDRYMEPLLEESPGEKLDNLLNMAQLALQKYLYRRSYRYNELFRYDYRADTWLAVNPPSDAYYEKLSKHVEPGEIEEFKRSFELCRAGDSFE